MIHLLILLLIECVKSFASRVNSKRGDTTNHIAALWLGRVVHEKQPTVWLRVSFGPRLGGCGATIDHSYIYIYIYISYNRLRFNKWASPRHYTVDPMLRL